MQFALTVFILALAGPLLPTGGAASASPTGKRYPVTRVVLMLKGMSKQLQSEQEADEEVYEKLACWCETNDKAKSKAILDAEARMSDLSSRIESFTAQSLRLGVEIEGLEKEVSKNQQALDVATALREKQLAAFNAEEKEMLQSIQALGAAIIVLSKHHGGASAAAITKAVAVVRAQMKKHKALLQGSITPAQRRLFAAFAQQPGSSAKPTFKQAYKPGSGQIFGILKQMKETFESNLSESQKEELANQAAYKDLKSAKEEEIAAGQASLEQKKLQLAAVDEKNAQAKEDLVDTENSLTADQKFLLMLKERCALTDKEWETRQQARQEELSAISQAIALLGSDDARDTFGRVFNKADPALLQLAARAGGGSDRLAAASLLEAAAARARNPKLALLASRTRQVTCLDAFVRVKAAIDTMVSELLQEQRDEQKHRSFCVNGLHANELAGQRAARDKLSLESKVESLKMMIKGLHSAVELLKSQVSELRVQIKRAGEDRELEHKDFAGTVADHREAQRVLEQALAALKSFYTPKSSLAGTASHMERMRQQPTPPPGFGARTTQAQTSTGVIMLIEQIIADTRKMEAEAVHDENEAQKAYEAFVQATNSAVDEKQRGIVNKESDGSKAEQELMQVESELGGVTSALDGIAADASALHSSCDFVLTNFEVRQSSRDQEVEALRQAKALLSGMKLE